MTVVKLQALKDLRASYLKKFNAVDAKIKKLCTHPKSRMITKSYYTTDTLGSNGWTTYYDKCTLCEEHIGEEYWEGRNHNFTVKPNYKEEEQ